MRIVLSTLAAAALIASQLGGASAAPSYAKGFVAQSHLELVKTKKKKTAYTGPSSKKHKIKKTSRKSLQRPGEKPAGQ
jgi:hypothetical protein